jgi:hypothetical protein
MFDMGLFFWPNRMEETTGWQTEGRPHLSVQAAGWWRFQPAPAAARLSTLLFQLSTA